MEFNYLASGSLHDLIGSLGVGRNFMERSTPNPRENVFFSFVDKLVDLCHVFDCTA